MRAVTGSSAVECFCLTRCGVASMLFDALRALIFSATSETLGPSSLSGSRAAPERPALSWSRQPVSSDRYLRGGRDRGLAVEFRFLDGSRAWYPYSWLGAFFYNPSVGLLLKFTGDTITLVLIRGSNLDAPIRQNAINLTDRGLQRHRITFIREMDEEELRKTGERGPTIDRIEMVELESQEEVREWITKNATAFLRK